MTDREILEKAEVLCESLGNVLGYSSLSGAPPFHKSVNPRRRQIWELAKVAFEELLQTDIDDTVSACEVDDAEEFPVFGGEWI